MPIEKNGHPHDDDRFGDVARAAPGRGGFDFVFDVRGGGGGDRSGRENGGGLR